VNARAANGRRGTERTWRVVDAVRQIAVSTQHPAADTGLKTLFALIAGMVSY
jgi:hypothetical protein